MIVPFVPFQVIGKRILALPFEEEKKTSLLILEDDKPKNIFIVANIPIGQDCPVEIGEKVLIKTSWSQKVTLQDVEYSIIHFDDILGVFSEE